MNHSLKLLYRNGFISALKSALEYQLNNFWNKDIAEDQKYTVEDFTIIEN